MSITCGWWLHARRKDAHVHAIHVISVHSHVSSCTRSFVSFVMELNTLSRGLLMDSILHHLSLYYFGSLPGTHAHSDTQHHEVDTCMFIVSSHASPCPTPVVQCCFVFSSCPCGMTVSAACVLKQTAPILNPEVREELLLLLLRRLLKCVQHKWCRILSINRRLQSYF